jgi:hypothetical protein
VQNVKPDHDKMTTVEKIEALKFRITFNRSNTDGRGYASVTARRGAIEITAPNITALFDNVKKYPKYYKLIFEDKEENELETVEISADNYFDAKTQANFAFANSKLNDLHKIRIRK